MVEEEKYIKYGLTRNPFPASGISIEEEEPPPFPEDLLNHYKSTVDLIKGSRGDKAIAIIGEYGSGKTTFLRGIVKNYFTELKYATFFFEDPGVRFYDLANLLFRQLGRYNFARALWELSKSSPKIKAEFTSLVPLDFEQYLRRIYLAKGKRTAVIQRKEEAVKQLGDFFRKEANLTTDEEIANKLGKLVIETWEKPFFDYSQFREGKDGLVAARMEHEYFSSLLKAIMKIYDSAGVVFLVDEFENLAVNRNIGPAKSSEYLVSLRNLLDTSKNLNFWVVIAMTPESVEVIRKLNPALWDRVTNKGEYEIRLPAYKSADASSILKYWLRRGRTLAPQRGGIEGGNYYPFSNDVLNFIDEGEQKSLTPRVLVRIFFYALEEAVSQKIQPPISSQFVTGIYKKYYSKSLNSK